MRTAERLDAVYEKALPVPFDDSSKFVFFSDVHRSDDSLSDEFGRNKHIYLRALNYYYDNNFTYVEIGDGDELWEGPRFEIIRNAHAQIFDTLKKFFDLDRLYMIYGNHNVQLANEEFVKNNYYDVYDEYLGKKLPLFPGLQVHEGIILTHRNTDQQLFLVHGHQGDFMNDQFSFFSHFVVRFLWRYMHLVGFKYLASPAKSRRKRHKVEKNFSRWNSDNDTIIICGHTHRPRFPDPGEGAYFNTGTCIHPRGITCLELLYGKLLLVMWHVSVKRDGQMYIKRTVLKGPQPISKYMGKHEGHKDEYDNEVATFAKKIVIVDEEDANENRQK